MLWVRPLSLLLWLLLPALAGAQEPVAFTYRARISEQDHYNSEGARLQRAADIVRQDRFYVHTGLHIDSDDDPDPFFSTLAIRNRLAQWLQEGISLEDAVLIEKGTPLVEVVIRQGGATAKVVSQVGPREQIQEQIQVQQVEIGRQHKKATTFVKGTAELRLKLRRRRRAHLESLAKKEGWVNGEVSSISAEMLDTYLEWLWLQLGREPQGE